MSVPYPARTERLILRPLGEGDVDVVVAYRNDPAVARYQDWELPVTRERVAEQVARQGEWTDIEPGEPRQIGIECDGELIGDLYVGLDQHGGVAEIGFTLRTEHQGKGYAYEAASAVVADLIERLGCHRIVAQLSPENERSARLLERLGMHVEALAPRSYWCRGAWDDNLIYAMSDADWRSRPSDAPGAGAARRPAGAIHHVEIWTRDLSVSQPEFGWLFTSLGWLPEPVPGWEQGRIWRAGGGEYVVVEQSPAISGPLDRMRAGVNHLALVAPSRARLDALREAAPAHGWTELFAADYPHAGGPDSTALYLANTEGFEVEIVVG